VKSPLSRWNKHPPGKPRTSARVTSLTTVTNPHRQHEQTTCRRRPLTQTADP
jgi:hypothetical protein